MSTLRTFNLQNPDSGTVNIEMDQGGNTLMTGIATVRGAAHFTSTSGSDAVGIGTDITAYKLDVRVTGAEAGLRVYNPDTSSNASGIIRLGNDDNQNSAFLMLNGANNSSSVGGAANLVLGTGTAREVHLATSGTSRLKITSAGNVAIGHNSAPTKLGIRGTSASTDATIQIVGNGVSTLLLGQDAAGGVIRGQGGSNQLKFKVGGSGDDAAATGGVEALRITSAGNIGVNKTTPKEWYSTYKTLQIYDGGYIAGSSDDSFIAIGANNYLDTGGTYDYTNTDYASQLYQVDGLLVFRNAPSGTADTAITWAERLRITSDGKLMTQSAGYVYTASSAGSLSLYGGNTNLGGGIVLGGGNANADIRFLAQASTSSPAERMRITSDGKVGIGTDNVDYKLEVFGAPGADGDFSIKSNASAAGGTEHSKLRFRVRNPSNQESTKASIHVESAANWGGNLIFGTKTASGGLSESTVERLRITSDGNVSVNHDSPNTRLYVRESGATISSAGNAIVNSTQKGIRLVNSNNDDTSLGLWFTTGDNHHSGITGQRNDSANTWGTDLRFYTHEGDTNDLTYTRERHRINPNGLLINRKGNNAVNTGGTILGRYKYTQQNQGSGYAHLILGADGRKLQDYITTNCYCIITVCVTGTGTNNMFCQYYYHATSSGTSSNLTHMYGNSGSSSNRPYINLQNTHDPAWLMSHNGGYTLDIEVAIYGGANTFTFTTEYGDFTTNP